MSFRAILVLAWLPLASQEPAPSRVADVYSPGDRAHWVFEKEGARIGACSSRYEGEVDLVDARAHLFRARVSLDVSPDIEQRISTDLWTDAEGRPLFADFRLEMGDVFASVALTAGGEPARAAIRQGPAQRELDVELPAGAYVLANNVLAHLELVLALNAPAPGESVTVPMFSLNVLQGFEVELERVEDRADEEGGALLAVYRDSLGETLVVDGDRRLVRLEVPSQSLVMRRVDEPALEFTIEPPDGPRPMEGLEVEEVTILHGDVSLAGTVTRPPGVDGPLPAVFFVSGSGGQDRQGFASGIDVGTHEILDRLTREGFLVLRVDDRGVGASTGPTEGMTFDDLVSDARACVNHLRRRDDVDPARVAVIGHSEGGQTAPILAAEIPEIAAIVLMAAPGRGLLAITREQYRAMSERRGDDEAERERFVGQVDDFFARLLAGEELEAEEYPAELAMLLPARAWLQSHARQDPVANLERVRCPVLVLQGARDIQVSVERDAPRIVEALERGGNGDHELVVFPELDHLFKRSHSDAPSGLEYLTDRPVDGEFLDVLVEWLSARLD